MSAHRRYVEEQVAALAALWGARAPSHMLSALRAPGDAPFDATGRAGKARLHALVDKLAEHGPRARMQAATLESAAARFL